MTLIQVKKKGKSSAKPKETAFSDILIRTAEKYLPIKEANRL
jgi:hypothetical protein